MLHAFKPDSQLIAFRLTWSCTSCISCNRDTRVSQLQVLRRQIHSPTQSILFLRQHLVLVKKNVRGWYRSSHEKYFHKYLKIFYRLCCNSWIPAARSFFTSICQFFNFRCAPDKGNTFAFTSTSLLSSLYLLSFKSNALSLRFSVARVLVWAKTVIEKRTLLCGENEPVLFGWPWKQLWQFIFSSSSPIQFLWSNTQYSDRSGYS